MQSAGGFIIDDLSTVFAHDSLGCRTPQQHDAQHDHVHDLVVTPRALTAKQEARLRSFLDSALEDITRGYRKRFDPSSSLHTLSSYLAQWMRLLGVLAQVPPYGSGSTNLLISHLLRFSTDLTDGITGYSLAMEAEQSRSQTTRQKKHEAGRNGVNPIEIDQDHNDDANTDTDSNEQEQMQHLNASRAKQLNLTLQTFDLLDRIWAAVLRGNLISLTVALSNARKVFPESDEFALSSDNDTGSSATSRALQPYQPRALHSTTSLVPSPAIDGRFISNLTASTSNVSRESLPIHGGRGNRTVGVTDQVRLRNIAISSREKLFSWMRTELDAPAPPIMDEHDPDLEPQDNTVEGALGIKQEPDATFDVEEEQQDDPDFEDVDIGDGRPKEVGYSVEEDTEEHKHYQDLFNRKLNPDEDDDEEDDDAPAPRPHRDDEGEFDQRLGASVLGTVEAVKSHDTDNSPEKRKREDEDEAKEQSDVDEPRADGLPSKRRREADSDAERADDKMSRSEMGSINFNLSDTIGRWDIYFTRIFSRTLRTLSDLSELTKCSEKPDFASSLAGFSGADEHETANNRK
ncbi:uncharacterized protein MEPE_00284 [Melanopsichium pennsylvanicum]|uniref:Uncharacterized protein n=2 Tax=Melanopsichium pennsylvanicum TaxID=63383 RepID=A0AAJ4XFL5_9BASI|nr:putative protein [Melanopsichium pennsylvanicum 4]SNX81579.1 uncharacterized protein MEPE_00284 [Melanopsichium pennsylvanicum]